MHYSSLLRLVAIGSVVALPVWAQVPPAPHPSVSASTPGVAPSSSSEPTTRQRPWAREDHGAPAKAIDTNTCVTCHGSLPKPELQTPAKEFEQSVHADDRIGCVGCHRGDPRDPTVGAHDTKGGFTPRPTHAEIAALCGGCHGDPAFVRQFNARLHTDQAGLFPLSLHGKLSAAGDENAPTCSTCHGDHDVQPTHSLSSPTHPRKVADLCGRCHDDAKRMKPYGIPTNQHQRWRRSSHARAVQAGNFDAPTCTGCHSPHSATPPRATSVGRICGNCHEAQARAFRMSPHSKAFTRLGLSDCVPCHDPHEARRPTWAVQSADFVCNRCHQEDGRPRQVAHELAQAADAARVRVRQAQDRVRSASEAGISVPGAESVLSTLQSEEARLSVTVHSLDPMRLKGPIEAVLEAARRAEGLVAEAERARAARRPGYYAAIALAVLLLGLLVAKAVALTRRRRRGET